jgi:hypothetical protein
MRERFAEARYEVWPCLDLPQDQIVIGVPAC